MNQPTACVMYPPLELVQQVRSKLGSVKMMPDVAIRALDIARDPDASAEDLAAVIQQDMKLATNLLALANSGLYSSGKPIASLSNAVARVGFRQTKNLVVACSLSSVMKEMSLQEEWIRDVLWKHSVTTAVIATHLNRALDLGLEGEEFTAGLVHDFGRTLLAVALPEQFSEFDPLDFDETVDVLARENKAIGSNHCDLGVWFAYDQGLPEVLQEVIRFHHTPGLSTRCKELVATTATADDMANYFLREETSQGYVPSGNHGPHCLEECGVVDAVERFEDVCEELFERAIQDASEMTSLD